MIFIKKRSYHRGVVFLQELSSYERVMTALDGDVPDRVPVMPLVQFWTAKQAGFNINEVVNTAEKNVYSQYYCARECGYDVVKDLGGIHAESEAMGSTLEIYEDSNPSIKEYFIKDYERDLDRLKILNPCKDGRLPMILEGVRRLKELSKNKLAVKSYLQAPFRHAAMLRGNKIYRDILKEKDKLKQLLEKTTYSQIIYGTALVQAGADIIMISDPTSSGDILSREQWLQWGFKYTKRLVKELKKTNVKVILHICGNTDDRLDTFPKLGIDGMSLDQKVDLAKAKDIIGDKICIIGNVDPTHILENTAEEVKKESMECIKKAGQNGNFILSSGCGVPLDSPIENIKAMVEAGKEFNY